VNVAAGILNGFWSWVLVSRGRRLNSPALVADGKHLLADVYTSIGVLGGVILAAVTGWWILDPLIAMGVAVHILWAGWGLVRHSTAGLMDAAPDGKVMERIREVISRSACGAHEICDRIEDALREEFGQVAVSIHVEPEHEGEQHGAILLHRCAPAHPASMVKSPLPRPERS